MAEERLVQMLKSVGGVERWNALRKQCEGLGQVSLGDSEEVRWCWSLVEDIWDTESEWLKGADLFAAELRGVKLDGADLRDANLRGANLDGANLRGTRIDGADLEGASLEGADLKGAGLQGSNLRGTYLEGANLRNARLESACLEDADLKGVCLLHADLKGTKLKNAKFKDADLLWASFEDADLRYAWDVSFNYNYTKGTLLSPRADDHWSVLRRSYTGAQFFLHLLFLALFLIPYGLKTVTWLGINQSQEALGHLQSNLNRVADQFGELDAAQQVELRETLRSTWEARELGPEGLTAAEVALDEVFKASASTVRARAVQRLADDLGRLTPCLEDDCEQRRVLEVLLGLDKGWTFWGLGLLLLIYNGMRAFITWRVNPMREEEERTHYTPALVNYRGLYRLHAWVVRPLFVLAIAAFALHAWEWLWLTTVWIPA